MTIPVFDPGLQYYVDKIKRGEPFSFVRYGDGEWSAIIGDRGRTSSGSQALRAPGLKEAMMRSIEKAWPVNNYILSLRPTSFARFGSYKAGSPITKWLEANVPSWVKWHKCTVFYLASRKGQLHPFIKAVRNLKLPIVVIGPARLRKLDGVVFPVAHFIQIPGKDCWVKKAEILSKCVAVKGPAFFTFTAGPAAKPIVWELFNHVGKQSFILDLGSLWDVYAGHRTRRYHRKMTPDVIARNLTGK